MEAEVNSSSIFFVYYRYSNLNGNNTRAIFYRVTFGSVPFYYFRHGPCFHREFHGSAESSHSVVETEKPAFVQELEGFTGVFEPEVWDTTIIRQESMRDLDRWSLLGYTFSVKVIGYLTGPFLKRSVRSQGKPVKLTGSVKEELSAMEPGDVWALFNENGRPNWYAVIKSRTGDRFSPIPGLKNKRNLMKLSLKIEMHYLKMTPN